MLLAQTEDKTTYKTKEPWVIWGLVYTYKTGKKMNEMEESESPTHSSAIPKCF